MRVLIVDPSPLAQNLYRVLLRNLDPEVRMVTRESLTELTTVGELSELNLLLVASLLLEGAAAEYRALLTDISTLADVPKLVMVRPGTNGKCAAWQNLPNATELHRPFRPEEFTRAVKKAVRE